MCKKVAQKGHSHHSHGVCKTHKRNSAPAKPVTDEERARRAVALIEELLATRFDCVTCNDDSLGFFVRDGEQLLQLVSKNGNLPSVSKKKCEATAFSFSRVYSRGYSR